MEKIYKVVVDYSRSLTEMIKSGNYDNDKILFRDPDLCIYANEFQDKDFPLQGVGQQEAELILVHLNRNATTKEVLEHLDSLGLSPAKIEHLLAFGATYPEIQKEFPVICLGSFFFVIIDCVDPFKIRRYPCLDFAVGKRRINLDWDCGVHRAKCRFLAIRKK